MLMVELSVREHCIVYDCCENAAIRIRSGDGIDLHFCLHHCQVLRNDLDNKMGEYAKC